jgi:DNA polymerase-1
MSCEGRMVALDTETTGLNPWQNHIIGVGFFCKSNGKIGYIPTLDDKDRIDVINAVNSLSSDTTILMHNSKFDLHFMKMDPRAGGWTIMDTTVMIHLLDSRYKKNLKDAETRFLGSSSKRSFVDQGPARTKIWDWPLHLVSAYCANDCMVTYQLAEKLFPTLCKIGLEDLFWKDMNYIKTLYDAEEHGVSLDVDFTDWAEHRLHEHIQTMEETLWDSCGNEFNWRSPQQLSNAIYAGLGIPKPKNPFADADGVDRSRFADAGKYKSTCTATFILTEKIHHPLGELISALREADKLRRNYLKWLDQIDDDEVLHTSFNITGTRTGRLSSSKPNLQNVASNVRGRFTQSVYTGSVKRTDEYNMRKAIIPRKGMLFLSIDYKQMEMRMFGVLSRDPFMLDALLAGKDVHLEIALKVWGDCGYDMNQVHREWSKTISFGQPVKSGQNKTRSIAGNLNDKSHGNQQPEFSGMRINGSETHSVTRTVTVWDTNRYNQASMR